MKTGERRADVTGAILAGGEGKRMGRVNKALLEVGGEPILGRLARTLGGLFEHVLVVARDAEPFADTGLPVVTDRHPQRSSLTGIHAALFHAETPFVFVTACDTPFLQPALVRALLAELGPDVDLVAPIRENGHYEPLCALYSRAACLGPVEDLLRADQFQIIRFFPRVRVRAVPVGDLRRADPDLVSFANANTPDDLEALRRLIPAPDHR
ncbi:MAG: molybdenum cofactor guanylyltransferase [Desulfovibrio aminophilus]|jgi:molybdopterin-guanine dinucleotide biosynthesis protein A|uniref:molybdenum cofactor guanylyltransferase n=1 Tax=Desulfovibrio aminophilus TaxID=81425 RepID=UPI0003F80A9D|nr:molybdenum cofactor guanylyltransferase [Desulfovibrio aminophilus]